MLASRAFPAPYCETMLHDAPTIDQPDANNGVGWPLRGVAYGLAGVLIGVTVLLAGTPLMGTATSISWLPGTPPFHDDFAVAAALAGLSLLTRDTAGASASRVWRPSRGAPICIWRRKSCRPSR